MNLRSKMILGAAAASFVGAASFLAPTSASAGPLAVTPASQVALPSNTESVRYRRVVRHRVVRHRGYRRAAVPAAVFGLFGAALGAAIASSNNDYYPSYGYYPAYGYNTGYGYPYGGYGYSYPVTYNYPAAYPAYYGAYPAYSRPVVRYRYVNRGPRYIAGPRFVRGPRFVAPRVAGPRFAGPRFAAPRFAGPRFAGPRGGAHFVRHRR